MNQLKWILALVLLAAAPQAHAEGKATWKVRLVPADVRAGEAAQVVVEAAIQDGWHIYSLTRLDPGPRAVHLQLIAGKAIKAEGSPVQPAPHKKFDEGFQKEIEEFVGAVAFGIPVRVSGAPGAVKATVKIEYQACDARLCLPPEKVELPLTFMVAPGATRAERRKAITAPPAQPAAYKKTQTASAEVSPAIAALNAPGGAPFGASEPLVPSVPPGGETAAPAAGAGSGTSGGDASEPPVAALKPAPAAPSPKPAAQPAKAAPLVPNAAPARPGAAPVPATVPAPETVSPPGPGESSDPNAPKVTWKARLEPPDARSGEQAQLVVEATILKGWHIYSLTKFDPGPRPVKVELKSGAGLETVGNPVQPEPKRELDKGFKKELEEFFGQVTFGVPVKIVGSAGAGKAVVHVQWQACDPRLCLPLEKLDLPVTFTIAPGEARSDRQQPILTPPTQPAGYEKPEPAGALAATQQGDAGQSGGAPPAAGMTGSTDFGIRIKESQDRGIFAFLWFSISMGFLALLTPCVFPMIPITVSFFSKQGDGAPKTDLRGAAAYCLGIIGTFTLLGLGLTAIFGAAGIQQLATNPFVNVGLALVFIVLALTLFEVIHPQLPSSWIERTQSKAGTAGLVGPILMGLTFSLTSFTCTVPFVGALLASAAQGNYLQPTIGMLGFSTAFSSPFFLLALFPQWLNRLPRAGGWLSTVKAFMGFLELAAAVKFLSNVDLVYSWGLLTRPVFLAVWSTLAIIAGCYLLGWLKLPNEHAERIGVVRVGFGLLSVVAGVFCLGAIDGRSLGGVDAFLPPLRYPGKEVAVASVGEIQWEMNYDRALERAKTEGKPLFVNFTGVTCTNCRWMESNMFTRADVKKVLTDFVAVELYTDKDDPQSARYKKLQQEFYQTVALPYYAVRTADGQKAGEFPGLTYDANEFLGFLHQAKQKSAQLQPGAAKQLAGK